MKKGISLENHFERCYADNYEIDMNLNGIFNGILNS